MQETRETLLEEEILEGSSLVDPIEYFLESLEDGNDWPSSLLKAMALWVVPEETIEDRQYTYFIGGEAFDWLLLAERLCETAGRLIPQHDKEELLFKGRFPDSFDKSQFKELLGVHKHRGYLNFFYGVIVEEALQMAAEREVHKRKLSNGNQYQDDFSEEAFLRVYRESRSTLLRDFRLGLGYPLDDFITLDQSKEFTYWLFKYRMRTADKAKIASDTRKGLEQLKQMMRDRTSIYPLT